MLFVLIFIVFMYYFTCISFAIRPSGRKSAIKLEGIGDRIAGNGIGDYVEKDVGEEGRKRMQGSRNRGRCASLALGEMDSLHSAHAGPQKRPS